MKTIFVKLGFEGTHCWPEAPLEVGFLRTEHRHQFNVLARLEVDHDDRELEFVMVKRQICRYLKSAYGDNCRLGRKSCESIAVDIIGFLRDRYPRNNGGSRFISVMVDEDGENGALVEMTSADSDTPRVKPCIDLRHTTAPEVTDLPVYTFDRYQKDAYTAIRQYRDARDELLHYGIGIAEEAGELLSIVKHECYDGVIDHDRLVDELGDILWYVSAMAHIHGIRLDLVAMYNVAKLACRYPNGVFDIERSINRHEIDKERVSNDES